MKKTDSSVEKITDKNLIKTMPPTITLNQAVDKVIAKMKGIMSRQEIVKAVLKYYPSKAKDPASSIMDDLRWRPEMVALGDAQYARADFVLDGAKFRITISEMELSLGILQPSRFSCFDQVLSPLTSRFVGQDGEVIPLVKKGLDVSRLSDEQLEAILFELGESIRQDPLEMLTRPLLGKESDADDDLEEEEFDEAEQMELLREKLKKTLAQKAERHDFSSFFEKHGVRTGDALLVSMKPGEKTYIFEHESADHAQTELIEAHDRELSQFIHQAIKRSQREDAREVIFRAYGKFAWLKEYPGSHWLEVVEKDDSLRLIKIYETRWEIASIDFRMPFDSFGVDKVTEQKLKKRLTSLEKEVEDFVDRLDEARETFTDELTGKYDEGGRNNVIKQVRSLDDEEKRQAHNERLIEQFFEAKKGKSEKAAGKKAASIEWLANYLSNYEGLTLEYADFDDVEDFLFDWYLRKAVGATAIHAKQMAGDIRDFYQFLVESGIIRSARFTEAIYNLRDLAGEKIELYHRLQANEEARHLYALLF